MKKFCFFNKRIHADKQSSSFASTRRTPITRTIPVQCFQALFPPHRGENGIQLAATAQPRHRTVIAAHVLRARVLGVDSEHLSGVDPSAQAEAPQRLLCQR